MPREGDGETRARKRVSNACQRCRKHKIKCSGTEPCQTCSNKGIRCEFGAEDRKVAISESLLHDLKRKLRQFESQRPQAQDGEEDQSSTSSNPQAPVLTDNARTSQPLTSPVRSRNQRHGDLPLGQSNHDATDNEPIDPALSPDATTDSDRQDVSNPLVPEQPGFIFDESGGLRYLGLTSTWSFSRQVLQMAHQSPNSNPTTVGGVHVEGDAYRLDLGGPKITPEDIVGLPSMELSMYYLQTVKFRTHPLFHLFDEAEFTSHLHGFYEHPSAYAREHGIWFVQYLVVMAFGKAFVSQTQSGSSPAGSELFLRALRLLPDNSYLLEDQLRATEIFCCIALYYQSIDLRSAALIYIGQAIRMAQSHGLHTDLQPDVVGSQFVSRGRRIWWTVFVLDRKLSCSLGLPSALRDEDITSPFPGVTDVGLNATGQTIHIKICQLLGKVVSTIYSRDGQLNKTFLPTVRTVLRGIAPLANELKTFSDRTFGEISRFAANLNLAYHHCILIATRPFMFYILKRRLEQPTQGRPLPLSSSAKGLVQVCIDSATQIVTIVSELMQHGLLDTFLPFDLESVFSAAFVLVMGSHVHSKLLPKDDWLDTVLNVLNTLAMTGNIVALHRKSEVEELVQILHGMAPLRQHKTSFGAHPVLDPPSASGSAPDYSSLPSLGDPFFDEWIADDGLSAAQIMNLADAIQPSGFEGFMFGPFGDFPIT